MLGLSEETRRSLKPVATRPDKLQGLCNVHKGIIDNCTLFDLSSQQLIVTAPNQLAKFLVTILKYLTNDEYAIKNSFTFAEEQHSELFMERLDVDPLFTNILLEEAIGICAIHFLKIQKK